MSSKKKDENKVAYSRENFFGDIVHYDAKGHKVGESRKALFGGYNDYDAKGKKTGYSTEHLIGGGYTHYDNHGNKIGTSDEHLIGGGYTHRDAKGHVVGQSDRSILDIKSPEERWTTGSLYGKSWYHQGGNLKMPPTEYYQKQNDSSYENMPAPAPRSKDQTHPILKIFKWVVIISYIVWFLSFGAEDADPSQRMLAFFAMTAVFIFCLFMLPKAIREENEAAARESSTPPPETHAPAPPEEKKVAKEEVEKRVEELKEHNWPQKEIEKYVQTQGCAYEDLKGKSLTVDRHLDSYTPVSTPKVSHFTFPTNDLEDEFVAGDFISGEDMARLRESGYDAIDLELMDPEERIEALEDAGVDPDMYDFDD